jgi:hypothetical protein
MPHCFLSSGGSSSHMPSVQRSVCRQLGVVRCLIFPRQFVKGRLVASCPVAILRNVELLMLVIFDAHTVLIAPAVTLSINAARVHEIEYCATVPRATS